MCFKLKLKLAQSRNYVRSMLPKTMEWERAANAAGVSEQVIGGLKLPTDLEWSCWENVREFATAKLSTL